MRAPDLAQGLRLENRRRVLRWGRAPESLRTVARPRESDGDRTFNYSPLLAKALALEPRVVDDGWCPTATWRVGPVTIRSELRDKNGLYHVLLVSRRLTADLAQRE